MTAASSTGSSFQWFPPAGLSCTACANSIATPSGAATYFVYSLDSLGCSGDTAQVNIASTPPPPPASCVILYAIPGGTGTGTRTNPTNLVSAINQAQCNNTIIKLSAGTHVIDNPISNLSSYTTLEGGFDPVSWNKSSQPGLTTILRSALNPEGPANAQRLVAFLSEFGSVFQVSGHHHQHCCRGTYGQGGNVNLRHTHEQLFKL